MSRRREIFDSIVEIQKDPRCVRNVAIVAHVDHGKSTLSDALIASAGLMNKNKAGIERVMDIGVDEKARGITIQSTSIALPFERERPEHGPHFNPNWPAEADDNKNNKNETIEERFVINLIDSPGHVDFSSEVTAALRVTDGAVVVVDAVEGCAVQTVTVLRQAIAERIKPVLFVNKLDRLFQELRMEPEEAYQRLKKAVESVNAVIATYSDADAAEALTVWPQAGTVAFGSGLLGFGFTLLDFARRYADKFDMHPRKLAKKMWGDHFYDAKRKRWVTDPHSGSPGRRPLPRGFNLLVVEPLQRMFAAAREGVAPVAALVAKLGINVSEKDGAESGKEALALVLKAWLPCGETLRDLVLDKLPSPAEAQRYRVPGLYGGEPTEAMLSCNTSEDENAVVYVSKLVPTADYNHFYAFGRVFSGTLRAGSTVNIQSAEFEHAGSDEKAAAGSGSGVYKRRVASLVVFMGGLAPCTVAAAPAGSLVGIVGIDTYISKTATITSPDLAPNFRGMHYSVEPIVRVAVRAKAAADNVKLATGLRKLAKSDPLVRVNSDESTGEHVIAGAGELHVQICTTRLERDILRGSVGLVVSEPVVSYAEEVQTRTERAAAAKSPNKLNRVELSCEPLEDVHVAALDAGRDLDLGKQEARRVWATAGSNVLMNRTQGVQYLNDVKDAMVAAFQQCMGEGVVAREEVRGTVFYVEDAKIHADAPHRGAGQIMPMMRGALAQAQLAARPTLVEPVYAANVTVARDAMGGVFNVLRKRRGLVVDQEDLAIGDSCLIRAELPVAESFGVVDDLRGATSGKAFCQLTFACWRKLGEDPWDAESLCGRTVAAIRARKRI